MIYSIVAIILFYFLSLTELNSYSRLSKGFRVTRAKSLRILALLLVTLAGLPPTIGFAMKWSIFVRILPEAPLVLIFLVLGSLISLYYYLCIGFR